MSAYELAAASQRAAADPDFSVFVTANAGSGKTKVLVDRIARLLLAGSPPSSFVCITYTKAAAAEMQRRLFERLGEWCVAPDDALTRDLQALIGAERAFEPGMLARARALFARALESPGGLKIQTIHAFCERLLGRFPLEAGVPPGFEIADDVRAQEMRDAAVKAVVEGRETRAAYSTLAARLNDERLGKTLARIMEEREKIRSFAESLQTEDRARAFILDRHDARESAEDLVSTCVAAIDWGAMARAVPILSESSTNDRKLADKMENALAQRGRPDQLGALADVFLKEKDGEPAAGPTKKVRQDEPWLARFFDDTAEFVARTRAGVTRWERAQEAAAALTLGLALDGAYAEAKARSGALDFGDLVERAYALLTRSSAAAWVLHKLDGGVDHILIDEGQDTSPKQWDLLQPLQDEFFAGAGARTLIRTVFAVGDHKQSIYSFQGADPAGFLAQSRKLDLRAKEAALPFAAHRLEMSFRSTSEVLHVVDQTFDGKDLGGDTPGVYDVLRHTAKRAEEGGRVEWWPLSPRAEKREARPWDAPLDMEGEETAPVKLAKAIATRVKAWIAEGHGVWESGALRPMRAGDVLVLVRSRGQLFRQQLKAFKRAGLPVAGADRMVLKDELAVEDCLTLLRVAADPGDDLALACLLKGPWIGLVDDETDIFPLAFGRSGEPLRARLEAASDAKYAPAREFVRQLAERSGASPHALVSWALERLDAEGRSGWELLFARLGEEARDPVEELLARALQTHRRGPATLRGFLAQIEAEEAEVKREMEEAGDSIRVMTVHGAKGLEAPIVFLPDTSAPAVGRIDDCVFFDKHNAPVVSASKKDDDAESGRARADAEQRAKEEHLRLLYVAMTRARDRLIVCGHWDGRHGSGAAPDAWHPLVGEAMSRVGSEIETAFGTGYAVGVEHMARIEAAHAPTIDALPDWARKPMAPRAGAAAVTPSGLKGEPPVFSPLREDAKRYRRGLLIHGLLERLPDLAPGERAGAAQAWLKRQGVDGGEAKALAGEAIAVVQDPAFSALFGPDSRAEAPIVGVVRGRPVRGIVDRLVVRPEAVEILDFKSDRPAPLDPADAPEGYVLQMALYREVLGVIFPGRTIACGLLWTEKPALTRLTAERMRDALDAFFAVEAA